MEFPVPFYHDRGREMKSADEALSPTRLTNPDLMLLAAVKEYLSLKLFVLKL